MSRSFRASSRRRACARRRWRRERACGIVRFGLQHGEQRVRTGAVGGRLVVQAVDRALGEHVHAADRFLRIDQRRGGIHRAALGPCTRDQRSPHHIIHTDRGAFALRVAGRRQRTHVLAASGQRLRQPDLRACGIFTFLERREERDRPAVRRDRLDVMLLQRLRKGSTNSRVRNTLRIASFCACCRTAGEQILRGRKPSGQQIRFRHGLQGMPDVRLIAEAVELGPALLEQSSRDVEVAQSHVHIGDAEQCAAA